MATLANGFSPEKVRSYLSRVHALKRELESERGKYMSVCKGLREDIKEVISEAREDGIPTAIIKAHLAIEACSERAEKVRAGLEPEDREQLDLFAHAAGIPGEPEEAPEPSTVTPIKARKARAGKGAAAAGAAVDDEVPDFVTKSHAERVAEEGAHA